jgi:hypothetical protein
VEYTGRLIPGTAQCALIPLQNNCERPLPQVITWRCLVRAYNGGEANVHLENPAHAHYEEENETSLPLAWNVDEPELSGGSDDELASESDGDSVISSNGMADAPSLNAVLDEKVKADSQELQRQWIVSQDTTQKSTFKIDWFRCPYSLGIWVIALCHGGDFAGAVFSGGKPVLHRCIHRYITRKKQGGRQSKCDSSGGCGSSAGSQIRRNQEQKWKSDIQTTLQEWAPYIQSAQVIFLHAPGPSNKSLFYTDETIFRSGDHRIQSIPFTTGKPTFQEVKRVYSRLTMGRVLPSFT